jgi:hypothetical protein
VFQRRSSILLEVIEDVATIRSFFRGFFLYRAIVFIPNCIGVRILTFSRYLFRVMIRIMEKSFFKQSSGYSKMRITPGRDKIIAITSTAI